MGGQKLEPVFNNYLKMFLKGELAVVVTTDIHPFSVLKLDIEALKRCSVCGVWLLEVILASLLEVILILASPY